MASRPAETRADPWIRLEEVEEFSDTSAKFVLGVVAISLLSALPLFVLLGAVAWLAGERMELGPTPPGLRWCFGIFWILGGMAALSFIWGLCCRWIRRRLAGRFLGPPDVRLRRPVGVDEQYTILIRQPVIRSVRIERLEVSLVCAERSRGTEVSIDGLPWPFIDQRDLYSKAHRFVLEDGLVPAGAAPEAIAEFDIPDATRAELSEREFIAAELCDGSQNGGVIRLEDRMVSWQIRIEVLVAGRFVRQAVFSLPSPRDGGTGSVTGQTIGTTVKRDHL